MPEKRRGREMAKSDGKLCGTEKNGECYSNPVGIREVRQYDKGKLVSIKKSYAYKKLGKK